MIVTCQNCDTSFQLDDARVPQQGIRVRCSRCKEAFFLRHPAATEAEAIDEVASRAASGRGSVAPDATQDLPAASQLAAKPGADVGGGADDEDWEFSVDPSAARSDPAEGDERALGARGIESSGLSLEGEDEQATARESAGESAFGSVDDFSSLMEEDDSIAPVEEADAAPGPAREPGRSQSAALGEDASEVESWDFFSDSPESRSPAPAAGAVLGRVQLSSPAAEPALFDEDDGSGFDDDLYGPGQQPPGVAGRIAVQLGRGAGWAITIALALAGLVGGLWPTATALVTSPQAIELAPLRAESIRGEWIETAWGETLLRVTGELKNPRGEPLVAAGMLEVTLLRSDDSPAAVEPEPAGLPLADAALRELPVETRQAELDHAAYRLSRARIEAHGRQAFEAVFAHAPRDAVRVRLDAAPMQPASSEPAPALAEQDAEAAPQEPAAPFFEAESTALPESGGADPLPGGIGSGD